MIIILKIHLRFFLNIKKKKILHLFRWLDWGNSPLLLLLLSLTLLSDVSLFFFSPSRYSDYYCYLFCFFIFTQDFYFFFRPPAAAFRIHNHKFDIHTWKIYIHTGRCKEIIHFFIFFLYYFATLKRTVDLSMTSLVMLSCCWYAFL